jgi:hypothetical protein
MGELNTTFCLVLLRSLPCNLFLTSSVTLVLVSSLGTYNRAFKSNGTLYLFIHSTHLSFIYTFMLYDDISYIHKPFSCT